MLGSERKASNAELLTRDISHPYNCQDRWEGRQMDTEVGARSPVQLVQLRAFEAVARLGSLTAAAEHLSYTEPAVHLQLAALAKAVGGKLFTRVRRGMVLTPLGESLLPFAVEALRSIDSLAVEAAHHRAVNDRVVRVGVGRSTGSYLFPHLVAAVNARDPSITLESTLMPVGDLYRSLSRGEVDIVYASGLREQRGVVPDLGPQDIVTVPFRRYHWILVALPSMNAAFGSGATITVYVPGYAHLLVDRLKSALPSSQSYAFSLAQDAEAAKGAAAAGMGVACVPAYTVGSELAIGHLFNAFPGVEPIDNMIYVGHARRPRHPDVPKVVAATRRLPHFSVEGITTAVSHRA